MSTGYHQRRNPLRSLFSRVATLAGLAAGSVPVAAKAIVNPGVVNILKFGTTASDLGQMLQAAHDWLPATGGVIEIPVGIYVATTGAVFTKDVLLSGRGMFASSLRTASPTLTIVTTSTRIRTDNLEFRYTGAYGAQTGRGILCTGGFSPSFFRTNFSLFNIGVEFTAAWTLQFLQCRFWDNLTNAIKIANTATPDRGDHEIIGCQFACSLNPTGEAAIKWLSSGGLKISSCKFLDYNYSVLLDPLDGNTSVIIIDGNSMEGFKQGAICCARSTGSYQVYSVQVIGNEFGDNGSNDAPKVLCFGAGFSNVVVMGNTIMGSPDLGCYGVYFDTDFAGSGSVSGNLFKRTHTGVYLNANADVSVGQNQWDACKVPLETARDAGMLHSSLQLAIRRPLLADSDGSTVTVASTSEFQYFWKVFISGNRVADVEVLIGGLQNGGSSSGYARRALFSNNGSAISNKDLYGNDGAGGNAPVVIGSHSASNHTYNVAVSGTANNDYDGLVIGIRAAASQTLSGALECIFRGCFWKVERVWQTNVRTGNYSWTLSGSGTGTYYCRLSGGDPSLAFPAIVKLGSAAVGRVASLSALTAGTWGYGDNDTLGYSTLYVRLSDDTDPDTKSDGYVKHLA